jgi:hypothetical protein
VINAASRASATVVAGVIGLVMGLVMGLNRCGAADINTPVPR